MGTIKNNLNINTVYTSSSNKEIITVQMNAAASGDNYEASIWTLDSNDNDNEQLAKGSVDHGTSQYNTISAPMSPNTKYRITAPSAQAAQIDPYFFHL